MLLKILNFIRRAAGLFITVLLVIQPWLIATETSDPFLYSSWANIIAGFISLCSVSILLIACRPKAGYVTTNTALFILAAAITLALYSSPYRVCLRVSLINLGMVSCIWALRLLRKDLDNLSIGAMISLSGFFMALYAICQATGHDFLIWENQYNVVGTLANSNFLGIFLCLTSIITLGMFSEVYSKNKIHGFVFLTFLIVQLGVVFWLNIPGHLITLVFMTIIWICSNWFKHSGRISKIPPFVAGFVLALLLISCQWLIYSSTSAYEWEKVTQVSQKSQNLLSRLILWQMGFDIFLKHKYTGAGAGAVSYIMPLQKSPLSPSIAQKVCSDSPHSFVVTTLSETGCLGLFGICILLAAIYGCYARKNSRYESVELISNASDNNTLEQSTVRFPWFYTSVAILILYLGFQSGFIKSDYILASITGIVIYFGLCTSIMNRSTSFTKNDFRYLGRSTFTAILSFTFYSLFNDSFSIIPLTGFLVLIISLHFSCCQPNVRLTPRFTIISILYMLLPIIYGIASYYAQVNYQNEQRLFSAGDIALKEGKWKVAEEKLTETINQNPQCLKAYYGLALALEAQHQPEQAQEVLLKLDTMVPNIFNVKYEIARILFENSKILEAHGFAIKNLEWAENPLSYEMLGKILLVEGRFNEAESIFKEGLNSIPSNNKELLAADRIRLSLAAVASERGDFKDCSSYLKGITTEVSENIDALYLKGMILTREKKYQEALEIFNQALAAYPHIPRLQNAIGYLLMETNQDLDKAQIFLEEAYQNVRNSEPPNLSELLMVANSLGRLYHKQNRLKEAGELLKLSYEGTPNEWKVLKQERLDDLNNFYSSFQTAEEKNEQP